MRRLIRPAVALALLLTILAAPAAPAVNLVSLIFPVKCGGVGGSGDFNNDGFADLAVGAPGEDAGAGAVNVIYGNASGLSATQVADQLWTADSPGVTGAAEPGDNFGYSLSVGDFDDDGYDDLGIGIPYENGTELNSGRVNVIYGSSSGLSTSARVDQTFVQGSNGVNGVTEADDHFGRRLASGDLNDDGYDDLVIGVPGENAGAGGAEVIYGSSSGLSTTTIPDQFWSQDSTNMEGVEEADDGFGFALTTGDFNQDGYDDLAAGVPEEDSSATDQGAVHIIYGSSGGLSATTKADQLWLQDTTDIQGDAEAGDLFGWSATSGDFNGDHYCDLATGVPGEAVGVAEDSGAVNVIYGSSSGLSATFPANQLWHRDSQDINGNADAEIQFGFALTAGDFNGDGESDLAIGTPFDTVSGHSDAGSVTVIYGASGGLSATVGHVDQLWTQDSADVLGVAEADDQFGYSLAAGNFTWDSWVSGNESNPLLNLAVGAPGEDGDIGGVHVLYPWGNTGLQATGIANQRWSQGANGVNGTQVGGDRFGAALR